MAFAPDATYRARVTSLFDILAAAEPAEPGLHAHIPDTWMQGRTAYGGLSAALALHATQRSIPELPPLRSAQVSFVGPLAGSVTATATLLRQGKNAAFVRADVAGEAGLGLTATFVFVRALQSQVSHRDAPPPQFPSPGTDAPVFRGKPDSFTSNFEFVDDRSDRPGPAEWVRWVRLAEREGLDPMVELIAIGDALPPAAMKLMQSWGPISSMTWLCNLLTPAPVTRDGWWQLRATSEFAHEGCSSQTMGVWNADGAPIASGMQSVALFV